MRGTAIAIDKDVIADVPAAAPLAANPSTGTCLSFGVGTIGTAILLNTVTVYLPAYMTTVLGRSAALAGLLITVSKLYDIGCDILIGAVSDRTRTRMGRRRPYMLAGALIGSLAFVLIFAPISLNGRAAMWEMAFLLLLYSTGYSLFNVPYLALPPEIAGDSRARTRLLSYRTVFVSVGQFVALSISGWVLQRFGSDRAGYALMASILAVIILAAELTSFFGVRERQPVATASPPLGLQTFIDPFRNRQFTLLMASKFAQLLGVSTAISAGLLFMLNVLKVGYAGGANFAFGQNLAIALSMPLWVRLSTRFGKRATAFLAIILYGLGTLAWLTAVPGLGTLAILIRGCIIGIGAGGVMLMASSMLPDAMEYDYLRTGLRREGVLSSIFAIVEKTAFAIGPGLVGLLLSAAGYIPTQKGHLVTQPESVRAALALATAILPGLLVGLSVVFLAFYRLNETTLAELRRHRTA
jgi:GPH family glycoside/pentoside/hexuronide:cation symporter